MTSQGFLRDFQFTKGVPPEAENFVEGVLRTMQTAFPKESKSSWKTKEIDMTGRYRAEYKLDKPEKIGKHLALTKKKLEYTQTRTARSGVNASLSDSVTALNKSDFNIIAPVNGAWISEINHKESLDSFIGTYKWSEVSASFTAKQITKDLAGIFPDTFDEFLADLNSGKAVKSKYYATDPFLDRIGAKLKLDQALSMYEQLKNSDRQNAQRYAEKFVVNYLRQHPKASFDLVKSLDADPRREHFDQSTQLIFWRLITEAGHTEAQQAVIEAALNAEYSNLTHIRALAYIHDFENPEPFMADALWSFIKSIDPETEDKQEQELKTISLYSFGSMGNDEKLNLETKEKVSRLLTDHLENAKSHKEQVVGLNAVGNCGGEDMLDNVEPFFGSENPGVRAAAFNALRNMESPSVLETLVSHYETETVPEVREAALKTLSQMPPTSKSVNWVNKTALKTEAPTEQGYLAQVLGKTMKDHPDNESTLREMLGKNPENSVKKEIYKYIAPK